METKNMSKQDVTNYIRYVEGIIADCNKELEALNARMREILSQEEQERLANILSQPFISIKGHNGLIKNHNYLHDLGKAHGINRCIFSVNGVDLDEVAVDGDVTLVHTGWNGETFSEKFTSPTWFDVWAFADIGIHETKDSHHVFLEGVCADNVEGVYHTSMGS